MPKLVNFQIKEARVRGYLLFDLLAEFEGGSRHQSMSHETRTAALARLGTELETKHKVPSYAVRKMKPAASLPRLVKRQEV